MHSGTEVAPCGKSLIGQFDAMPPTRGTDARRDWEGWGEKRRGGLGGIEKNPRKGRGGKGTGRAGRLSSILNSVWHEAGGGNRGEAGQEMSRN